MNEIKINNINFFEDYQEVAFSVYENGKLVEQNVAITQLPLSAESIHTINGEETELAQIVAELASESKIWREYDSDEAPTFILYFTDHEKVKKNEVKI